MTSEPVNALRSQIQSSLLAKAFIGSVCNRSYRITYTYIGFGNIPVFCSRHCNVGSWQCQLGYHTVPSARFFLRPIFITLLPSQIARLILQFPGSVNLHCRNPLICRGRRHEWGWPGDTSGNDGMTSKDTMSPTALSWCGNVKRHWLLTNGERRR